MSPTISCGSRFLSPTSSGIGGTANPKMFYLQLLHADFPKLPSVLRQFHSTPGGGRPALRAQYRSATRAPCWRAAAASLPRARTCPYASSHRRRRPGNLDPPFRRCRPEIGPDPRKRSARSVRPCALPLSRSRRRRWDAFRIPIRAAVDHPAALAGPSHRAWRRRLVAIRSHRLPRRFVCRRNGASVMRTAMTTALSVLLLLGALGAADTL